MTVSLQKGPFADTERHVHREVMWRHREKTVPYKVKREVWNRSFTTTLEGNNSAHNSILDFQDSRTIKQYIFVKTSSPWYFVTATSRNHNSGHLFTVKTTTTNTHTHTQKNEVIGKPEVFLHERWKSLDKTSGHLIPLEHMRMSKYKYPCITHT